jgi:hypothetical protein
MMPTLYLALGFIRGHRHGTPNDPETFKKGRGIQTTSVTCHALKNARLKGKGALAKGWYLADLIRYRDNDTM